MKLGKAVAPAVSTLALGLLTVASLARAGQLEIVVQGVAASEGQVMVQVLDSEAAFTSGKGAVAQAVVAAMQGDMRLVLPVGVGQYGVRVFHDRNGDGKMKTNLLGMPQEPYGFSNNATGSFGPPKWPALLFDVTDQKVTQTISLSK